MFSLVPFLATSSTLDSLVLEDFESYKDSPSLAKAWYVPPHGSTLHQSLTTTVHGRGGKALQVEFTTSSAPDKNYSAICRVHRWPVRGDFNAIRFWIKPDGSGHDVNFELNLADEKKGNVHDLWGYTVKFPAGDDKPRTVTIPFSNLVRPKWLAGHGLYTEFHLKDLVELAMYFGGSHEKFGSGTYVIDDIELVNMRS